MIQGRVISWDCMEIIENTTWFVSCILVLFLLAFSFFFDYVVRN